ncbi:hypothetical protein AMS68_005711 [Peltaster fructicola]|uniref:CBS domain-containing protein n=1 Tax=Peltaster fructicola TaxID=286661 RepID=A0A6H0XZL7_9PEZI|nr:hypothetical protein AMS68_005711 [Peltaster fructicola]
MASNGHTSDNARSPVLKAMSSSTNSVTSVRKETSTHASPVVSHRSSLAENLRNYPSSPRSSRHQSFSNNAFQELLMHPTLKATNSEFKDRDWKSIQVHEIVDAAEARFVELDTSVEDTTRLLVKSGAPNVVLIRESVKTKTAIGTFDYSDLNAYLLLVLGLTQPDEVAETIAERARSGEKLALRDVLNHLGSREQPAVLAWNADLTKAMELLGSGSHRVIITKEGTSEAISVLSQLRLVRFFWENHQNFAACEQLYMRFLKELGLGVKEVISINGDRPVSEALLLMHHEGVTSLPVLDAHRNVVGNISHVDVRLLTDTSSIPLLSSSCIHFISVILSERGMEDGKDAYPVFYVSPYSTLAHTVAKLCATRSHRMWLVDEPSPANSVPPSPIIHAIPPLSLPSSTHSLNRGEMTSGPPYTSTNPSVAVPASQLPGQGMSGTLMGVISLTDVLNLFGHASGLSPKDPEVVRRQRRRSSSSSLRPNRMSIDGVRPSGEFLRQSGELGRSSSRASKR